MFQINNQDFRLQPFMIIYLIVIVISYGFQWGLSNELFGKLILSSDLNAYNLISHQLMHAGPLHLAWNMILIWLFAGAVSKLMPWGTVFIAMLCFGIIAGLGHYFLRGTDAVGASGGIYGLIGMTLILYGRNRIIIGEQIRIPVFVLIALMIAYNLIFLMLHFHEYSQWGHLCGFTAGLFVGMIIYAFKRGRSDDYDKPLF
jgi:rhomboid protease GluP